MVLILISSEQSFITMAKDEGPLKRNRFNATFGSNELRSSKLNPE